MSSGSTTATAGTGGWGQAAAAAIDEWSGGGGGEYAGLDDYDSADVEVSRGGGKIEVEGAYHLQVADATLDDTLNRNGRQQITVRLVCLHSVPGQSPAGSAMWHHIELPSAADRDLTTKSGKSLWVVTLAAACDFLADLGLFERSKGPDGKERYTDRATGTTKLQFSTIPQRLNGLQLIGRPKRRDWEKDGKSGFEMQFPWGRGASLISDPQNAHIPINEEAAAAAGWRKALATTGTPAPAKPHQPAKQTTIPGTVAPADPYAEL